VAVRTAAALRSSPGRPFPWSTRQHGRIRDEEIARFVVDQHPAGRYPAVLVGSSNGGLTHLAAAPGVPQTFRIPVHQRGIDVDEPEQALEFGRAPGRHPLAAGP
jgi:hypothetical protein